MERSPQSFTRVLSSMCTRPHPQAREAATRFLATNPGDPGTFPTVASIESEVVEALGEIADLDDPTGYVASGGTEANIQAVRIARERSDTDTPNVVLPASAHFSFHKAASLLDLEVRVAETGDDGRVDLADVKRLIDNETALVVGVAGTTEYGRVDPIPALCDIAATVDARVHVDAAWGGFILPFTDYQWHFGHSSIDSMTIDPHKLGQAAIPAGGLLVKRAADLEALSVNTPYLHTDEQPTLLGTRSGAGVASAHAAIEALWPEGYHQEYERANELAEWLTDRLHMRGFEVVEPTLPIVSVTLADEVFTALRDRGWRVSRTSTDELRIVVMPHVTREMLEEFLTDLDTIE